MSCYTYNGITLTEEELFNRVKEEINTNPVLLKIAAIVYKKDGPNEILQKLKQKGQNAIGNPKYIPVTKFITAIHDVGLENKLFRLTPEYIEEKRKELFIEENYNKFPGNEETARQLAAESFDLQSREEDLNNKVGSELHALILVLLEVSKSSSLYKNNPENSPEYQLALNKVQDKLEGKVEGYENFLQVIIKEDPNLKDAPYNVLIKETLGKLTEVAKNTISDIYELFGNDCTIYPEIELCLDKPLKCKTKEDVRPIDYDGIVGKADLVVVDSKGKVHIVDYKVCSRPYSEWYQAKLNEVEYQLATYRAMLAEAGLDGGEIDLYVKPILFEKLNISSLKEQLVINETNATWLGHSRIHWRSGEFTKKLRENLGIGKLTSSILKEDTELGIKIDEDLEKIITYDDPQHATKLWYIDNEMIEKDKDNQGNIIGYKFYSVLTHKYIRRKRYEDFTDEGGVLDTYIEDLNESRNSMARTVVYDIKEFKENLTKNIESDKTFLKAKGDRAELLMSLLGKYINPEWQVLDNLPDELIDRGIIIFTKEVEKDGKKETILDIVTLAESPLMMNIGINKSHFVTGKHLTDELAKLLGIPLESSYRNIKAVETATIVNTFLSRNPDIFSNAAFGRLLVLNPNSQQSDENYGVNMEAVVLNFSLLASEKYGNVENHLLKLRIPKTYEYCMSELLSVINSPSIDKKLKMCLKNIDAGETNLEAQIAACERAMKELFTAYKEVQHFGYGGDSNIDITRPALFCYLMISLMLTDLRGKHANFTGRIPKWAATPSELISILGILVTGQQADTNSYGYKHVGLGSGMELSSPQTNPSETVKAINEYYETVYNNIRKQFLRESHFVSTLTKEYCKKRKINLILDGENLKIWERLLVHDGDKLNPQMIVKNPYDMTNDLLPEDREFLKQWLYEVNKWRMKDASLKTTWHYNNHKEEIESNPTFIEWTANNDSKYFQLPLSYASLSQRTMNFRKIGIKNWFEKRWKDFEETYSPNLMHNERRKLLESLKVFEMYDNYDLNANLRNNLINSVASPYEFTIDFDFLALDVAFLAIRKDHYDHALLFTEAMLVMLQFVGQTTGADVKDQKQVGRLQADILKGESIMEPELLETGKWIGAARSLTSIMQLACRPLLFFKEIVFGLFTNYSRAWILKFGDGSNKLSMASVAKATNILWGQRFGKLKDAAFGDGTLADFHLCEQVNNLYGIANQDMSKLSENASMSRNGLINNYSRWMYIAQSAPDYYNRMTLLIAKMIEDGCFDAHTLDKDGLLHYDWKKDKRFSELAKHGLNSDYNSSEYNKQKALYVAMCKELEEGGLKMTDFDPATKKVIYKDLDLAYTPRQRASIKEVADMAYGFYDRESKSLINHKFLGLMYLLFQTYLSAKYNLWFKNSTKKGKNTSQGRFKDRVINGVTYYDVHVIEGDKYIRTDVLPETELTEELKRTCLVHQDWEGDFVEGLAYSLLYTIRDICTLNWKDLATNKLRRANAILAIHDLLLGIIVVYLLKMLFSGGSGKMSDIEPTERVLVRAMLDIGPSALGSLSLTPAFILTLNTIKTDGIKLLSGSEDAYENILKHVGASRDFIWDED